MSQVRYQIIVKGQLVDGFELEAVKRNVAKLFKTEPARIEALFSGQPVTVKKDLDEAGARKYMLALRQAGLVSKGRPMPPAAPAPTPVESRASPAASATPQGDIGANVAAVGETLDQRPPPPPANISTEHLAMGFVGEELDSAPPPPAPDIDTSALATEAAGVDLDRTPPPPEPDIDISHLGMDEVGVDIDTTPPPEEPDIAIDGLTMAEAGEEIMEHPQVPPARIDTSKLQLTDE